jgi:RNA polymerase sigma-70 factor (ECF subfamily)
MTVSLDAEEQKSDLAVEDTTPETILLERSCHQRMQTAIEELPLRFREIILLCDVEEMSYQEIAETLSIPAGTVMSRLSRARAELRRRLQDQVQTG